MKETFSDSLWSHLAAPGPTLPRLMGKTTADVAVIGSGILGLSLALHLAQQGVAVVLIDKNEPGFGASGRNTGFVVPSTTGQAGPSDLVSQLGTEAGEKLGRFIAGSGVFLFDLVKRLGIECAAENTGWLQPAHTPQKVAAVEARFKQWRALGHPVELLDAAETRYVTGATHYARALLDPTGGQLNPLAYARGLAAAALSAGARIYRDSPALSFSRAQNKWKVKLPEGEIIADQIFCTTNAMIGDLLPEVRKSIIPVRSFQVATQPLGADIQKVVLPKRQPVADIHRHTFAYRWSPDNRLMTGGAAVLHDDGSVDRSAIGFLKRLRKYIPGLPSLTPAFAWTGIVAVTDHRIPQIWSLGPGFYAPIGCNGRGVAITSALGARLASFARTGNATDLPIAVGSPQPKVFSAVLDQGPKLWLGWSRLRDAIDDRFNRVSR